MTAVCQDPNYDLNVGILVLLITTQLYRESPSFVSTLKLCREITTAAAAAPAPALAAAAAAAPAGAPAPAPDLAPAPALVARGGGAALALAAAATATAAAALAGAVISWHRLARLRATITIGDGIFAMADGTSAITTWAGEQPARSSTVFLAMHVLHKPVRILVWYIKLRASIAYSLRVLSSFTFLSLDHCA